MNYQELIPALTAASEKEDKKSTRKNLAQLAKIFQQLEARGIAISELDSFVKSIESMLSHHYSAFEVVRMKSSLTQHLNKTYQLVTTGYYQSLWMVLGMSIFGIPLGMTLAFALDNFGLFAIGLPIGMPLGMAIGMTKDKKASQEGRVLEV